MSRFGARPRLRPYVMVICAVMLTSTVTARSLRQVPGAPLGGAPGVVTPQPPRDRAAAAAPKGDGTLKGRVVRADSGAPLPRARVVLGGMGGSSASPFTTSTAHLDKCMCLRSQRPQVRIDQTVEGDDR